MADSTWPLFDLRLRTPRLELRLPTDADLVELGRVAVRGVHDPATMPFAYPWTDQPSPQLERGALQHHWRLRAEWTPERWHLPLAVVHEGRPAGVQELMAEDFPLLRTVSSGSWLGRAWQGRGLGREMRAAVLHLAFAGLEARLATTEAFADNHASLAVTRALGYVENGWTVRRRRDEAAVILRFVLERDRWRPPVPVDIEALDPCLPLFGLAP